MGSITDILLLILFTTALLLISQAGLGSSAEIRSPQWRPSEGEGESGFPKDQSFEDESRSVAAAFARRSQQQQHVHGVQERHGDRDHETAVAANLMTSSKGSRKVRPREEMVDKFAYFGFNGRWRSHSNLTYALSTTAVTALVPRKDILFALEGAFRTWAAVVPLTFALLDDEYFEWADIKVSFLMGDHGDGQPFDGGLGVLAHSFAPEDGRLHLDLAEQWSVDVFSPESLLLQDTMDLQSVLLHEAGHLIGMGHSDDPSAAMFADISPRQVKHDLSTDDIQGAQSLYGPSRAFQVLQGVIAPSPSSALGEGRHRRPSLLLLPVFLFAALVFS